MEISENMRKELIRVQAPSMCALVTLETILEHQKEELHPLVFHAILDTLEEAIADKFRKFRED